MEELLDYAPARFYGQYSLDIEYKFEDGMLRITYSTHEGYDCVNELVLEEKVNVAYNINGNTLTGKAVSHLVKVPHAEFAENLRTNSACEINYWGTTGPYSLLNTSCFQGETASVSIELIGDQLIIDEGLNLFREYKKNGPLFRGPH